MTISIRRILDVDPAGNCVLPGTVSVAGTLVVTGGTTMAAAAFSGIASILGGLRVGSRAITTSTTVATTDGAIVSTATTAITATLSGSSNTYLYIKNAGTAKLTVAAPGGTAPGIDGAASLILMPGDQVILNGLSLTLGTWTVALSTIQTLVLVPTLTLSGNAGAGAPTPTLDTGSNDRRGRIQVGTGTSPIAGTLVTVTFATPYATAPFVDVGVAAQNGTGPFVSGVTTTGFNVGLLAAPGASQPVGTYAFWYRVSA